MSDIVKHLDALLSMPDDQQVAAALALIPTLPEVHEEAWNSDFGPGSLFDAWTQTSIASGVHARLAERIRPVVANEGFVVVEVGAGDGRTWSSVWTGDERGTLIVIDPSMEAIMRVADTLPEGVEMVAMPRGVQRATLQPADLIVCSMTLHHRAGRNRAEREAHGLEGKGKAEILAGFLASVRPKNGSLLLVEADVDCELHLPPKDPILRDNIFDSYVRRCARSILHDVKTRDVPDTLRRAWLGLLQHWFLGQLEVADLPVAERDVYELRTHQWTQLLESVGFTVQHTAADDWALFQLYEAR